MSRRSESHRSVRHEAATPRRSTTTWSIPAPTRWQLMARPAGPAPITTTGTCTAPSERSVPSPSSGQLDLHGRRVGDDVVDGRALLGLGEDRLEVGARAVGVDVERGLDRIEAV